MAESKQATPPVVTMPSRRHFHPFIGLTLIISGFCLAVLLQYGHIALASFRRPVQPEFLPSGMHFANDLKPLTLGVGPVRGNKDATVSVVEFSDYECPLCHEYFQKTYPLIQKNYIDTGKIMYEIRNYPLSNIHPRAVIAAEAAMCALKQDTFDTMHDILFNKQDDWVTAEDPLFAFQSYALALGLDEALFKTCLETHETQMAIQQDVADAKAASINGTPTFWIFKDGVEIQKVNGAYPYAFFEQTLDALLEPEEPTTSSSTTSSSSSSTN